MTTRFPRWLVIGGLSLVPAVAFAAAAASTSGVCGALPFCAWLGCGG